VVNQLARRHRAEMDRLVRTVERLRRPHRAAPMEVRELIRDHRRVLQGLLEAARGLLGEAGAKPAPALLSRVSATLVGAAADPAGRRALRDGTVGDEPSAPGFEIFAGDWSGPEVPEPEPTGAESRRGGPAAARDEDRAAIRAREALRVATAEMEEAERRAHEEADAARQARRAAERARQDAERARDRRASARQALGSGGPPD
jgi:hypothetical protein